MNSAMLRDPSVYCGLEVLPPTNLRFQPKVNKWNRQMLMDLSRNDIALSAADRKYFLSAHGIRPDLEAEYDADRLCQKLVIEARQKGVKFSPEFRACEIFWRRDEWWHFVGFRRIFALLENRTELQVEEEVAARPFDYSGLEDFFGDEFRISILIAYDELVTTRSYSYDRKLYERFGHPSFLVWFNEIIIDEAFHLHNFAHVVAVCYPNRLSEAETIIDRLVERDLERLPYSGGFLLDRRSGKFEPGFLRSCGEQLKRVLYRNQAINN